MYSHCRHRVRKSLFLVMFGFQDLCFQSAGKEKEVRTCWNSRASHALCTRTRDDGGEIRIVSGNVLAEKTSFSCRKEAFVGVLRVLRIRPPLCAIFFAVLLSGCLGGLLFLKAQQ